jgi:hypothetical protein
MTKRIDWEKRKKLEVPARVDDLDAGPDSAERWLEKNDPEWGRRAHQHRLSPTGFTKRKPKLP